MTDVWIRPGTTALTRTAGHPTDPQAIREHADAAESSLLMLRAVGAWQTGDGVMAEGYATLGARLMKEGNDG